MYLFMRKKIVYLLAKTQTNVGPTVPAGPIYEEVRVLPTEEIELNINQAYGPCSGIVNSQFDHVHDNNN